MMSQELVDECRAIKKPIVKHIKKYLKINRMRKRDLAGKAGVSLSTLDKVLDKNNIKVRLRSIIKVMIATETKLIISLERRN